MEISASTFEKFNPTQLKKNLPRTSREEQIQRFLDVLNPDRIRSGRKVYAYPRIAKMLQGIPTEDLHAFYQKCQTYRSFGAGFHFELKPR